jgi:hypothetical protein
MGANRTVTSRQDVAALLTRLGIRAESDAHGLTIRRFGFTKEMPFATERTARRLTSPYDPGGYFRQERWRLQCGGGIAGNLSVWHLAPVSDLTWPEALGPYKTLRAIEKATRAWRRWEQP